MELAPAGGGTQGVPAKRAAAPTRGGSSAAGKRSSGRNKPRPGTDTGSGSHGGAKAPAAGRGPPGAKPDGGGSVINPMASAGATGAAVKIAADGRPLRPRSEGERRRFSVMPTVPTRKDVQALCTKQRRLPMLLDMVEDRVRSRFVTVATVLLVFAMVFAAVLQPLYHDPFNARLVDGVVGQVNITSPPPKRIRSGDTLTPQPVVRLGSAFGTAVGDKRVTVDVQRVGVDFLELNDRRIYLFGNSTWAFRLGEFSRVFLEGDGASTVSVKNGLAYFDHLQVTGNPGDVEFIFSADGVNPVTAPRSSFTSNVASIEFAFRPPLMPTAQTVSQPLDLAPRFRLLDSDGNPVYGRRCVMQSAPFSVPGAMRYSKPAVYTNAVSRPSDANGLVEWDEDVGIAGCADSWNLPAINCEGVLTLYNIFPLTISSPIGSISIDNYDALPASVVEGEPLAVQPRVRVLDSGGRPLSGVLVFARIHSELGLIYTDISPQCVLCQTPGVLSKDIENAISAYSDEDGIAEFHGLKFSVQGQPGDFELAFDCVGLPSQIAPVIMVTPAVSRVSLSPSPAVAATLPPVTAQLLTNCTWADDDTPCCEDRGDGVAYCNGEVLPPPAVYVADARGDPLPGKAVTVTVASTTDVAFTPLVTLPDTFTDHGGYVTLDGLRFVSGASGEYQLHFTVDGVTSDDVVPVTLSNYHSPANMTCASLIFVGDYAEYTNTVVAPTEVVSGIQVKAVNSWNAPVPNLGIVGASEINLGATAEPSATTDDAGVATFSIGDLMFSSASTQYYFANLAVNYDRVIPSIDRACTSPLRGLTIVNPIADVRLQQIPRMCTTGQPMSPPPRIQVVDADGNPVPGTHKAWIKILDFPTYIHDFEDAPGGQGAAFPCGGLSADPLGRGCHIFQSAYFVDNGYVEATSVDGVLEFTGLGVKRGRPGLYVMSFYVDGFVGGRIDTVCSDPEGPVAAVELSLVGQFPTAVPAVGASVWPGPAIKVTNSTGQPIEGVRVLLDVVRVAEESSLLQRVINVAAAKPQFVVDLEVPQLCKVGEFPFDSSATCECPHLQFNCGAYCRNVPSKAVSDSTGPDGTATFSGLRFCSGSLEAPFLIRARVYNPSFPWNPQLGQTQFLPATATFPVPLGFINPVKAVQILTAPPSTGALAAPFARQPVVQVVIDEAVRLATGFPIAGLAVRCSIGQAASDYARRIVGLKNDIAFTDSEGRAYFFDLALDVMPDGFGYRNLEAAVGDYTFVFDVYGSTSPVTDKVTFTQTPELLAIVQQPPPTATVRELFAAPVLVSATLFNGAPVRRVRVAASIVQNAGRGVLDVGRKYAETDDDGIATFYLNLAAGTPGNYSLAFAVNSGLQTPPTSLVLVANTVAQVEVRRSLSEQLTVMAPVATTPRVLVSDADGSPLPNRKVAITFRARGDVDVTGGTTLTSANGVASFDDLLFVGGQTGAYEVGFDCDGILSAYTTVHLTNLAQYDASKLDAWKTTVYVFAALSIPLFWGNSARHHWWVLAAGTVWSFVFFLVAVFYADQVNEFVGSVFAYPDPYLNFLAGSFVAVASCLFLSFGTIIAMTLMGKTDRFHQQTRLRMYLELTFRLLPTGSRLRLAALAAAQKAIARERAGHTGPATEEEVDAAGRQAALDWATDKPAKVSVSASRYAEAVKARFRSITKRPTTGFDVYQTSADFFYPQRLLVAAALSVFTCLVFSVGYGVLTSVLVFEVDQLKTTIEVFQLQVLATARDVAAAAGNSASDVIGGAAAQLATSTASTAAAGLGQAASASARSALETNAQTSFVSAAGLWVLDAAEGNDLETSSQWLQAEIEIAGATASVLAFCTIVGLWAMMLSKYKQRIFELRRGKYFFDKTKFGAKASINYIGIQLWHTVLGHVVLFFILFLAVFLTRWVVIQGSEFLQFIPWERIFWTLVTVSLVVGILEALALSLFVTRGPIILHRRLFGAVDLVYLFVGVAKGAGTTLARFILTFVLSLTLFVRCDESQAPEPVAFLDPGYASYVGMIMNDHNHSNPLLTTICNRLWEEIKHKRWLVKQGWDPSYRAMPRKRAAMVWLAVTLVNNPQLILHRAVRLKAKPLAWLPAFAGGAMAANGGAVNELLTAMR